MTLSCMSFIKCKMFAEIVEKSIKFGCIDDDRILPNCNGNQGIRHMYRKLNNVGSFRKRHIGCSHFMKMPKQCSLKNENAGK